MTRFLSALGSLLAISGTALVAQAPTANGTVTTSGCIRLWKPAPDDPTKMPPDRQPGQAGSYLLTPMASTGTTKTDLPTYLLTPSATLTFSQHIGHQVEITGTVQAAVSSEVEDAPTAPTLRPENKAKIDGLLRLTATTLKMVGDSCP